MSQLLESISIYFEYKAPLSTITEDGEGNLYTTCMNGDVITFKEGKPLIVYIAHGQPTSIAFDDQNFFYLADPAAQNIISQTQNDSLKIEINILVKEYEGSPLEGPNTLTYSSYLNTLFFTDSGIFGATSFENPKGSVFYIDFEVNALKALAYKSLAYPTGLAVSEQGYLYVAETCKNRILRFVRNANGIYNCSTFYQFSGRFGPTAVVINPEGLIFAGRYDFAGANGCISVLSQKGELLTDILIDGYPEILGLSFSKNEPNLLYIAAKNVILKAVLKIK